MEALTTEANLENVCELLDKLTLNTLTLMEKEIQLKLDLEKSMCNGEMHLAKSRYIMGTSSISALQLPTGNSPEFEAIATVHSNEDVTENLSSEDVEQKYDLEMSKTAALDPIKWFGILVPQNLHFAQNQFRQCVLWAVKIASVQSELYKTLNLFDTFKEMKGKLVR